MKRMTRRELFFAASAAAAIQTTGCGSAPQAEAPQAEVPSKAERFAEKMIEDLAAGLRGPLSYLGDRLGIFQAMASGGAMTVEELAQKTALNARYLREWLGAMVAAEYLEYQPAGRKFVLPPEHAAVLADEESPLFAGGGLQFLVPAVMVTPKIQEAFRTGKGVAYSDYMPEIFEGIARWSAPGFKHQLVQKWIPAMPQVEQRLREGGTAADVGCGQGLASIVMAQAFPQSRFWGFDPHGPSIERARANAQAAGVADRVTFEALDGARLPARQFDLISSFDVLHDSADPPAIVRSVRLALAPEGTYLCYEPNLSPNLEDNINLWGRLLYPATTLYCMSVSLGQGGAGIGADIHEGLVQQWAAEAGLSRFRQLLTEGPFAALYEMRI
jgi:SAM-dependent methyltransferase